MKYSLRNNSYYFGRHLSSRKTASWEISRAKKYKLQSHSSVSYKLSLIEVYQLRFDVDSKGYFDNRFKIEVLE